MSNLQERLDSFDVWHYQFEFPNGEKTKILKTDWINLHEQRKRYFFDALVKSCGGSLDGMSVIDMACNAGWWSAQCLEAGAEYVYGIDRCDVHIEQAKLIFEYKGYSREKYGFSCSDVYDLDSSLLPKKFDIILCLGLLYHVCRPFELFEIMTNVYSSDRIVIDTRVAADLPQAAFLVSSEDTSIHQNAIEDAMVFIPSKMAIFVLAKYFGYKCQILKPRFTSYRGAFVYKCGQRRAFILKRDKYE